MFSSRRRFLEFLAASPLLAQSSPKEALNVMDFEALARKALPPAHFGYMSTGVDDDGTLAANRAGYQRIQLRPRRLVDVRSATAGVELFGTTWDTPIIVAPCGSQKAFHPEGEVATARACGSKKILQILSTVTTSPIDEVMRAAGKPIWYQLYPSSKWEVTLELVRRAEAAGCPALVLTVDAPAGRNTETLERLKRTDTRQCTACHSTEPGAYFRRKPMFTGIKTDGLGVSNPAMTWDSVRRLRDATKMKLLLKGIVTREDAALCGRYGVDGIIVSNHGGREEESLRGTIECLPEVVEAAGGKIPVLVDGGIRRGTDIFKALALGARAVCIGRPYLWGLSAYGTSGVERVLEILRAELELIMKQCGARSIAEISRNSVVVR